MVAFTMSSARYWAKEAYRLRAYTGRAVDELRGFKIDWATVPNHIAVTDPNGNTRIVPIAKSWLG